MPNRPAITCSYSESEAAWTRPPERGSLSEKIATLHSRYVFTTISQAVEAIPKYFVLPLALVPVQVRSSLLNTYVLRRARVGHAIVVVPF